MYQSRYGRGRLIKVWQTIKSIFRWTFVEWNSTSVPNIDIVNILMRRRVPRYIPLALIDPASEQIPSRLNKSENIIDARNNASAARARQERQNTSIPRAQMWLTFLRVYRRVGGSSSSEKITRVDDISLNFKETIVVRQFRVSKFLITFDINAIFWKNIFWETNLKVEEYILWNISNIDEINFAKKNTHFFRGAKLKLKLWK